MGWGIALTFSVSTQAHTQPLDAIRDLKVTDLFVPKQLGHVSKNPPGSQRRSFHEAAGRRSGRRKTQQLK
jgi:hypothetical protein